MNWYKKAQAQILWHISNNYFKKFDPYQTAQGIIWFSKDKEDLITNLHGASITSKKPIYLYKCQVNMEKSAGWTEYDKYGISELKSMGFDSINLDEDVAILKSNNIKILEIKKINELV